MRRLCDATLHEGRAGVALPAYDRSAVQTGIVHIGPGAFFRAHQATYMERLLARDPRWGIAAISLNSASVRDALAPQDGLYVLAEIDREPRLSVIGALREIVVAPQAPAVALARLTDPRTRLITMTVTEKGYRLDADGELDLADLAIAHDLAEPQATPHSLTGRLAKALAARRAQGAPPLTVLSCDNLSDNGGKLSRSVSRFAEASGARDLARWIEQEVRFPRTMVDSITPATDDAVRSRVDQSLGLHDAWPVQREPFLQWVIEDAMAPGAPDLASVGATLSPSVTPFEQAKLRLLNGAHSTLAYLGLLGGLEAVAQAMAEPRLAGFVERLMREAIAPTLAPSPDLDIPGYIDAVLERFRNPAMRHELAQIAWDGSKKLPVRLLATTADALAGGRPIDLLAVPVAAWMRFIRLRAERGETLVDPLAQALQARLSNGGREEASALLAFEAVFPRALCEEPAFREGVLTAHAALARDPFDALPR